MAKVGTSPLTSRGSPPHQSAGQNHKWPTCGQSGCVTPAVSGFPPLQSGGQNHKWPTCGQSGYVAPAVSGTPIAVERGAKSEVAHLCQSGNVTPSISEIPSRIVYKGSYLMSDKGCCVCGLSKKMSDILVYWKWV